MMRTILHCAMGCAAVMAASSVAAQQTIGTVSTAHASVTGNVTVQGSSAQILNSGTVKAGDESEQITLARGGSVTVCTGSTVQLSQGTADKSPMLFALNRGATEIKTSVLANDVLMTPDLRFNFSNAGPLDLQLRVTPEGDTCVENRGDGAPFLHVTEQFGVGGYFIKPGQRVLFEHGSLKEVVDREKGSCGCPQAMTTLNGNSKHPFPAAISQGLAEPEVPNNVAPAGETHTQISTSVSYNGREEAAPAAPVTLPKPEGSSHNPFVAIGHFFKKVFGGD